MAVESWDPGVGVTLCQELYVIFSTGETTMANTTGTMKNKNEDRPFGTHPSGPENKPRHDGGNITDKARDLASTAGEKARETASNVTDKARETASNVTDKARDLASNVGEKARDAACAVASKASEMASNIGHKAGDATAAVGGGIKSLAESIRENAPESGMLKTASTSVADSLESGVRYLEQEGFSGIGEDLVGFVRRNPIPAMCVGVAFGFLLAKATSSRS